MSGEGEELVRLAIKKIWGENVKVGNKNGMKCVFYKNCQIYFSHKTWSELVEYARSLK